MSSLSALIVALAAGACAGPVLGDPAAYLSCGPQSEQSGAMCAQMRSVIEAAEPALKIKEISLQQAAPEAAVAVRLWVDTLNAHRIAAHLEWRAPQGAWQKGQVLSMNVMDTRLNDAMVARFLGTLWAQSKIDF